MSNLQTALRFLEYYPQAKLFPAVWENGHKPRVAWSKESSGDPRVIKAWGATPKVYFCIAMVQSGMALIDTDNKNGKQGDAALSYLELVEYEELPRTLLAGTPSGGHHRWFIGSAGLGTDKLGHGIDLPVMAPVPGSVVEGKGAYPVLEDRPMAQLPQWVVDLAGKRGDKAPNREDAVVELDQPDNVQRAINYLHSHAPEAVEGHGGDATAYKVVAHVRDLGVSQEQAEEVLHEHYADKCSPYDFDWLQAKITNAYRYAQEPAGSKAPPMHLVSEVGEETQAEGMMPPDPEENFVAWLNQDHALTTIGGKVVIIKEREDGGLDLLRRADFETFMLKHRVAIQVEDKKGNISTKYEPAAKIWLGSKERRESKGVCFRPDGCPDGHTNMWRGFAMEPHPDDERCSKYRWHVENIICGGDPVIIRYVWAWLADIIQHPGNKPGVAIALKGGKGVGKGMFAQPILKILGRHAIQIQSRDLFIGRFNGHMADKVFVFLDEAYWHGDKAAEGKLKGFITEPTLPIEQKGIDAYTVDSFHRVLIASNEAHVVPAGMDERRFLVLDVKDDRQQDKAYFGTLAKEMKNGGVEALMSWLGRYDYKGVDLRTAPNTDALMGQKLRSLEPHAAFWLECLHQGSIDGFTPWPEYVRMSEVHGLYLQFCQRGNVTRYPLTLRVFVDTLFGEKGLAPKMGMKKTWSKEKQFRQHRIMDLENSRRAFDKAMRGSYPWEEPENGLDDL